MGKLTAAFVRNAKPGRYSDGDTLILKVVGNSKGWIQRLTVNGKRSDIGLGSWPLVSLQEARDAAFENRRAVRAGADPLAEKRKAKVPTFEEAAALTFAANKGKWKHASTAAHWTAGMKKHALPVLGNMPVDRIGPQDVLRVVRRCGPRNPRLPGSCVSESAMF